MALEHGEQKRNLPVPRALIVANLIAMVLAVLGLVFGVPAAFRQSDADAREREWREALYRTAGHGSREQVEEMLKGRGPLGHEMTFALTSAADEGNTPAITVLLQHGAIADSRDRYRRTPLTEAIHQGKLETAQALLRGGATVDFPDGEGKTPLHHAAETGNLAAIRLLIQRGANLNARDHSGKTPLQLAEAASKVAAARLLRSQSKD